MDPERCIFPKFNEDGCRIKDRRQRISPHGAGTPENLPLGISHCPTAHLAVCAVCAKVGCISANARTNFIRLSQIHISQSLSLTSSISVLCRGLGEVSADPTFGLPLCHGTAKFVTRRFAHAAPGGPSLRSDAFRCTLLLNVAGNHMRPGPLCDLREQKVLRAPRASETGSLLQYPRFPKAQSIPLPPPPPARARWRRRWRRCPWMHSDSEALRPQHPRHLLAAAGSRSDWCVASRGIKPFIMEGLLLHRFLL